MKYLIDYFMFVVKEDTNSPNGKKPDFDFILNLLGLTDYCNYFTELPGKHHYYKCYKFDNIRIYEAPLGRFDDMGYMVELTGQGCRFLEADYQEKNGLAFSWTAFAQKLVALTSDGYSLNINRIDFAFDDYDKLLNLDTVLECVENREYVSLFRSRPQSISGAAAMEWSEVVSYQNVKGVKSTGRTIYLGSRRSHTYCRFYDKLMEQKYKNRNNEEALKNLDKIDHWLRFEIVFRGKPANSLLMSLASLNSVELFSKYLSEVVNGYIRFIDRDDKNVSRCTIKKWWADFLDTAERSTLTCPGVKKDPLVGAVHWLKHSLAPTLSALIERLGTDEFFNQLFEDHPEERYSAKHKEIINGSTDDVVNYALSSSETWVRFLPDVVLQKLLDIQEAEYEFTEQDGEQLEI